MKDYLERKDEFSNIIDEIKKLNFNKKLCVDYINEKLSYCENHLKKLYKEIDKIRVEIPDDPSIGVDIYNDGILNENPHLKCDSLENYQHQIGYFLGFRESLKIINTLLSISKSDYDKMIKENKEIEKQNKENFKQLKNKLKKIKNG
jgi:hypothetical protein